MFRSALLVAAICSSLALVNGQANAGPYGQCGGQGWSGPTICPSGYTCTVANEWYSQCLPGLAPTTPPVTSQPPPVTSQPPPVTSQPPPVTSQPPVGSPSITSPAPGTTPTLVPGFSFIRAVTDPNFHKYLRSQTYGTPSDAVLGEYTTAALFKIESGQLIQSISGVQLYAHVEPRADANVKKLKVSWKSTPATEGTFRWSGDTLEWSNPSISRPQANAWLVCPDAQGNKLVYINLGPYSYQTPAGCADHTIHAYTGPIAVP